MRLTYVVNHVAFFVSHRLPLALAARERGYDVELVTGQAGSESMEPAAVAELARHGIPHVRVAFTSDGISPLTELRGLWQLAAHLRRSRPALVHCVSPKGILYGGAIARLARVPALVLAVSGMGFAFSAQPRLNPLRSGVALLYRLLVRIPYGHGNKRVIVQNQNDMALLIKEGIADAGDIELIHGSGVDLNLFQSLQMESKEPIVLFPARMIYDKGVMEFVAAARQLKAQYPEWRFVMAGAADYRNPANVPREQLQQFQREGIIEWMDHVPDMIPLYLKSSIGCLPSYYGEGLPKSLLEAAAAGCAVVTADSVGCREAIVPGVTGLLVPPRSIEPLAEALQRLISDRSLREGLGRAGCKLARDKFDLNLIVRRIVDMYGDLLKNARR